MIASQRGGGVDLTGGRSWHPPFGGGTPLCPQGADRRNLEEGEKLLEIGSDATTGKWSRLSQLVEGDRKRGNQKRGESAKEGKREQ